MHRHHSDSASERVAPFDVPMGRRRFVTWLGATLVFASQRRAQAAAPLTSRSGTAPPLTLNVAAIQMNPKLADVDANLAQAHQLLKEAARRGARWILLPEMFTTAAAFHEDMIKASRPVDGAPARLLRDVARESNAVVGGSFLAQDRDGVHNSFLLAFPDGAVHRHDKDLPTYWETCYYQGGRDDGVLETSEGPVGVALCWEMVRSDTAKRLLGKVKMLLAGSTWWTLPEEAPSDHPLRAVNLEMLQQAPSRLARMLGVPVAHASHAGPFAGFDSPELPDVPYRSAYLGETAIIDHRGRQLARLGLAQGAGVITADIVIPDNPAPTQGIPERFWLPEQMPQEWKDAWERWFERGEDYYQTVTLAYLKTGQIPEYVPPYLR